MLEPSDLHAAVNRLLVGLGQIVTAALLLVLVAGLAAAGGNLQARNAALLSLAFTTLGYALQLVRMTAMVHDLVKAAVVVSWITGIAALLLLLMGI